MSDCDENLKLYAELCKYSLADLLAWIGFHAGNGRWSDGVEVSTTVGMIREFMGERTQ